MRVFSGKSYERAALSFQNVLSAHLWGSSPNHLADENKLPKMKHWKRQPSAHKRAQPPQLLLTKVCQHLMSVGAAEKTSDVFDRYKKLLFFFFFFSKLENVYWPHHEREINPLQCHFMSIVISHVNVYNLVHLAEGPVQDVFQGRCQKKSSAPSKKLFFKIKCISG